MSDLTANRVPIHITAHHLSLSEPLCDFVRDKLGAVGRIASDVLAVEAVLRRASVGANPFSVSVRLALPGKDIHGAASAPDLYVAVGLVATKLERRLRKRKTRLSKTYSISSRSRTRTADAEASADSQGRETTRDEFEVAPEDEHDSSRVPTEPRVFVFRRKSPATFTHDRPA